MSDRRVDIKKALSNPEVRKELLGGASEFIQKIEEDGLTPKERAYYLEAARERYAKGSNDDVAIDDNAKFSAVDNGVWVQAWVWVRRPEKEEPEDELPEGVEVICENCGEPAPYHSNYILCEKCKAGMIKCDRCGERYEEAKGDGYCGLCPKCADATQPCGVCGRVPHDDNETDKTSIADHGRCFDCHKKWQHGEEELEDT